MEKRVVCTTNSFDVCLSEYCIKNNIPYIIPQKGSELYENVRKYQSYRTHTPTEDVNVQFVMKQKKHKNMDGKRNRTGVDTSIKKK